MSNSNRFTSILQNAQEHLDPAVEEETAVATTTEQPSAKRQPAQPESKPFGRPPTGKRSNPDYEPTTVILRRETKIAATRILVGNKQKDLSDVMESLLAGWVRKNS